MKKLIVFFMAAGMLFAVSCGPSAAKQAEAEAEKARQDSIAQAQVEAAKQAVLDSLAQVAEQEALQARMDSMENALKEQEAKAKKATTTTTKKVTEVAKEPEQAKPTRAGATKRE
ncbi:MAG TPA: hypothetical protein PLE85_00470 [Bacteroidales bacterium]|mgnify:CR=1 FL=1|nr:hypothetical protein [Bacteroidales bacterium]